MLNEPIALRYQWVCSRVQQVYARILGQDIYQKFKESLSKILTCPSISTIISTTELNEVIIILWELIASHNKELNLSAKKFKQTINQIVNAVSINVEKKLINTYIHTIFINFFFMLCLVMLLTSFFMYVHMCAYVCVFVLIKLSIFNYLCHDMIINDNPRLITIPTSHNPFVMIKYSFTSTKPCK